MIEQPRFTLTDRQSDAWHALHDPGIKDVMYGGAKGGGKSWFFCVAFFMYALEIIDQFKLTQSAHPIPLGWMGRKQSVDFSGTTLETWFQTVPAEYYVHRPADKEIVIGGAVKFDYGGLDRIESVNKFNSAEYGIIGVDQAEETLRDDVAVLMGSRRRKINGHPIPYKGLWTANPGMCWLKDDFILTPKSCNRFVQALPTDNPHLPDSYIQTLRDAFSYRPELLAAYLDGSWDATEGVDQIIKDRWIQAAMMLSLSMPRRRKVLCCDMARQGDDETVIYGLAETQIVEEKIYGQKDMFYTANTLHRMAIEGDYQVVAFDDCPVSDGLVENLAAMSGDRYTIMPVVAAGTPSKEHRYLNIRAEMWDGAARKFAGGEIEMQPWDRGGVMDIDQTLRSQLCSSCYKFASRDRLQIEPKSDIKSRLGCSPDRAEAYLIGLYALDRVHFKEDEPKLPPWREKMQQHRSPMSA